MNYAVLRFAELQAPCSVYQQWQSRVRITAVDSFTGKLAAVTGGGSGMGRELVRQLAAQGCSVVGPLIAKAQAEASGTREP